MVHDPAPQAWIKAPMEPMVELGWENFEETKILFFDDIDLPNISKLSLYGEGLGSTNSTTTT